MLNMEKSRDKSLIEKTVVGFIYCVKCGKTYESIMMTDNEWKCESCGNPFPTDKDGKIMEEGCKSEEVDAIRCDKCNELTSITPENLLGDRLICGNGCNDWKPPALMGHTIAIKFRQTWYPQSWFLRGRKKGIQQAANAKDRVTLSVLNRLAKADEHHEFMSVDKSIPAKIYWLDGNAVAYYTYTLPPVTKYPTLHQIFVRPEYRRRGIATELMCDFIKQNIKSSNDKLAIESPDDEITQLLLKIGEWKRKGDEILCGRILYLPSAM